VHAIFDATTAAEMCWRSKRSAASDSWNNCCSHALWSCAHFLVMIVLRHRCGAAMRCSVHAKSKF